MRIGLIPLDDRPCNAKFPVQLGRIAGWEVEVPETGLLGNFLQPGNPEAITAWCASRIRDWDAVIFSVDMLAYGGLVASRVPNIPLPLALRRLENFITLLSRNPGKPCYAFNAIMRTLPTRVSAKDISKEREVLKSLKADGKSTSSSWMQEYWRTRERNHTVNRRMLSWVESGNIDFGLLGADDWHKPSAAQEEINRLQALILNPALNRRAALAPGSDEMAMLLLARLGAERCNMAPAFRLHDFNPEFKLRYEPGSLGELLSRYLEVLLACLRPDAGLVLYIHSYFARQGEAAWQKPSSKRSKAIRRTLRCALQSGERLVVADVAFANGADLCLTGELLAQNCLPRLASYAAWNTAGNTLGTALAQAVLSRLNPETPAALKAQAKFILERLADDSLYQAQVRRQAQARTFPQALRWVTGAMSRRIRSWLKPYDQGLRFGDYLLTPPWNLRLSFPWQRLFEIDLDLDFNFKRI